MIKMLMMSSLYVILLVRIARSGWMLSIICFLF